MARPDTRNPNEAVVCIGSNTPECQAEVSRALLWLTGLMTESHYTRPYQTAPEGTESGDTPYVNAVFKGTTEFSVPDLTAKFKAYERLRGRKPTDKKHGKIIIDVDLVLFNGNVIDQGEYESDYFQKGFRSLSRQPEPLE